MTTHNIRCMLIAAMAVVIGLTAQVSADSRLRPFAVTLDGNANPQFQPDGCTIINDEQGTGHARHMGNITWQSHEVVDVCSNPIGADVTGQIVLTAANGDQVYGDYTTLAHLDFGAGQVTALGHFQISGGTGRFAQANGKGVISAVGSLAPPLGVIGGMTGTITY
jgi:hypothetical protein